MKYETLFSPISVRNLTMKNRICLSPMGTGLADENGGVTEELIEYYRTRARGGAGLITVEVATIHPQGKTIPKELALYDDRHIPDLARLVKAIHAEGAKASIQLHHPGRSSNPKITGAQPIGPSPIPCPMFRVQPRELSTEEVAYYIGCFAEAVRRAQEAGFDLVEIHGGHGYLVAQFLSPLSNSRTDPYGGSMENRARFPVEILERSREKVGQDYPLAIRISGNEYVEGGFSLADALSTAPLLEKAGADLLDISGGTTFAAEWIIMPMCVEPGVHVPLADAVKKVVRVPVMTVGRIHEPKLAEEILQQGKADMIAMGRQLIADPDWPEKVRSGSEETIFRCIACNECLHHAVIRRDRLVCTQNPAAGREADFRPTPCIEEKHVVVVGGGPGGLEAARIAAMRGHRVTVLEKGGKLGGRLRIAAMPPHKAIFQEVIQARAHELETRGVKIHLNAEATLSGLRSLKPDAVIIATGTKPLIPDLPGVREALVMTYDQALAAPVLEAENIAVIGGGSVGCEVADFLSDKGKKVWLVEMLPKIALDMEWNNRVFLLQRLSKHGVQIITSAEVTKIGPGEVTYLREGESKTIGGLDAVVLAVGMLPDDGLYRECVEEDSWDTHLLGDARRPRKALEAVREGAQAGLAV